MVRLLFVGDGDRDVVTVPHIVKTIVGIDIESTTQKWARLHVGGLERKVRFALVDAEATGANGTVMTVDADRSPAGRKLRALIDCRKRLRRKSAPFPMAFGCAVPHGEAWLLADPTAVRIVLRLDGSTSVPSAKRGSPKESLQSLMRTSVRAEERPLAIWAEIAMALDPNRCTHTKQTGFRAFVKEIESEIRPLGDRIE